MNNLKQFLITVIGLSSLFDIANAKVVICYYGTWSHYRSGEGKFEPKNIDPSLCTHINYAFFGITSNGELRVIDKRLDLDSGLANINRTVALKKINPKLKIIAAVGGWNEGSKNFSHVAASAADRKRFIDSSLTFISEHGFDGLDLDWNYPVQRGGSEGDKENLVTLLKEMREAPHNLELSIAVGASKGTFNLSYDIKSIEKHVEYINLMTFDFVTGDDAIVGFNAPLTGQGEFNVKTTIEYWLQQGAPASKLVAGLPFYGHSFTMSNPGQMSHGSKSSGPGKAGPHTQIKGVMGYHEICEQIPTWNYYWADDFGVPCIYKDDQWIGYDDVQSIEMKMDHIKSLNLGGVMVWSIETDDFHGMCGETYPLLKTINRKFNKID